MYLIDLKFFLTKMKYLNVCEYITMCVVEYFVTMIND